MELVIKTPQTIINTDAIHVGDFIRAQYSGWTEARNGLVAAVTADEIRVIWQPGIRNVTNYFTITVEEAAGGLWAVRWSPDMETIIDNKTPSEGATEPDIDDEL